MTDEYPPLTPTQREVVLRAPEDRTLVTAGPGTGKTHTLIARLAYLIEEHELSPGAELLVLSFSRAAVREIRARLATVSGDARYVNVSTFDSFATRLLSVFDEGGSWVQQGYDGRIRDAIRVIEENADAKEFVHGYRHVVVDEIQDLITERSLFVKTILLTSDAGFTLFGDPAQGIYTWQLDRLARIKGAGELWEWLGRNFADLLRYRFSDNHRALTKAARTALWAGVELSGTNPDYERIRFRLDNDLLSVQAGTLQQHAPLLKAPSMSTAILCRNNGEALLISRELHSRNIPHRLQRGATDRALPAWIARVLYDADLKRMSPRAFRERVDQRLNSEISADEAWAALKQMDPSSDSSLNLEAVNRRIRTGNVPDELTVDTPAMLVVSTIHRAKGLEFDRVILTEPDTASEDEAAVAEEARLLYVALSRPRRELLILVKPKTAGMSSNGGTDRWIRRGIGSNRWRLLDFEISGDDVHREDPAGGFLIESLEPPRLQNYIAQSVRSGDPISLVRVAESDGSQTCAYYGLEHAGNYVGVTSESFGDALYRALKLNSRWRVRWPSRFENINVEAVDTVAGTEAAGASNGLGPSGLWLRVRVVGLAEVRFD